MKELAVVCPTLWDHSELPRVEAGMDYRVLRYGSDVSDHPERFDAIEFIESAVIELRQRRIAGIFASDDYPASIVAAAIAQELGLPGPALEKILLCQHKYYCRLAQLEVVPEAVPDFVLIDPAMAEEVAATLSFPVFVKPVKSYLSVLAEKINDLDELRGLISRASPHLNEFTKPFDQIAARYTSWPLTARYLLAEGLLRGDQVTVEGCVFRGDVAVIGITDSIMHPGTICFERFVYPSSLGSNVQRRMQELAVRFIRSIGFDNGLFNIEMFHDPISDTIHIIEVNPRMCPQFADLMEKVNGVNTYEIALAIAAGVQPRLRAASSRYSFAASFVFRVFEDQVVIRVPTSDELRDFGLRFPDARLKILGREGHRLSEEIQDGKSYRYAILNLGGSSHDDLLSRFDAAQRDLNFVLEPVRELASEREEAVV